MCLMFYLLPWNIREFSDRKRFPRTNHGTVKQSEMTEMKQVCKSARNDNVSYLCKRKFCSSENICSTQIKHVLLHN